MKNIHTESTVYLCTKCEQINQAADCPTCGQTGKPIPRSTANNALWKENVDRMIEWCKAGRFLPELENEDD